MFRVADSMGVTDLTSWTKHQRQALMRLAPTIALALDLDRWSPFEKRTLVKLVRAKSAPQERDYIARLSRHKRFQESLAKFCRARSSQSGVRS